MLSFQLYPDSAVHLFPSGFLNQICVRLIQPKRPVHVANVINFYNFFLYMFYTVHFAVLAK
jgi:hypothetical protein